MEPRDQKDENERPSSGAPPESAGATATDAPPAGSQAIGTDDPVIQSGPPVDSGWNGHPDRAMVVETSRIRGPNEAFNPNFVVVPVESARPQHDPSARSNREDHKAKGQDAKQHPKDDPKKAVDPRDDRRSPSMSRLLLYAGVVSFVCGIFGAWGYSYLFGPSKSDDHKSSSKNSDSGKDSDSDKNSDEDSDKGDDSSRKDSDSGKLLQAQAAWMTAVKELQDAQSSEKSARRSEEEKAAVLEFLKHTLLSAGRPGDVSLTAAFWAGGQGKDLPLRKAVDMTEAQVADAFLERPVAEASVRELLGQAYLSLGDPAQAVKQYERAYALRQAMQGANQIETAALRNQLAVAYRLAGRADEGGRLFDQNADSATRAATLDVSGRMLLMQKHPAQAELKLRESLAIRQKVDPDEWLTFDTKSVLGEAILDQERFADAEPLLLSGYEGLKKRQSTIPPADHPRVKNALDRLVRLYDAWGKKDEATRWRKEPLAGETPPPKR